MNKTQVHNTCKTQVGIIANASRVPERKYTTQVDKPLDNASRRIIKTQVHTQVRKQVE